MYVEHGDNPFPSCGSYDAELIEEAGGTGPIWGYWGLRPGGRRAGVKALVRAGRLDHRRAARTG